MVSGSKDGGLARSADPGDQDDRVGAEELGFRGLGEPLEYLNPVYVHYLSWRWRCTNLAQYRMMLWRARTAPSGVFAMKVLGMHMFSLTDDAFAPAARGNGFRAGSRARGSSPSSGRDHRVVPDMERQKNADRQAGYGTSNPMRGLHLATRSPQG